MLTIGIDIGGRSHAVARCRDGNLKADREIVRISQSRAGFSVLDAWLDRQPEPVSFVTMESSGHYWMPLASHLRRRDVPVAWSTRSRRSTLPRAGWLARSPTRPTLGVLPRWPCVTAQPLAIR